PPRRRRCPRQTLRPPPKGGRCSKSMNEADTTRAFASGKPWPRPVGCERPDRCGTRGHTACWLCHDAPVPRGTGFACCVAVIAFVLAGCTAAGDGGPVGPSTSVRIPAAVPSPPSPSSSPSGSQLPGATPPGTVPPVVAHGPRTGNKVALTFDTNMTDARLRDLDAGKVQSYANVGVIDLLEQRRVPATIFLAGKWVQRYPQVTARLAANPLFELGNHSFAHEGFTPHCYGLGQLPADQMSADVAKAFDVVAAYGGHQT